MRSQTLTQGLSLLSLVLPAQHTAYSMGYHEGRHQEKTRAKTKGKLRQSLAKTWAKTKRNGKDMPKAETKSKAARCMAALNPNGNCMVAVRGEALAALHGTSDGTGIVLVHGKDLILSYDANVDDLINDTTNIDYIYGGNIEAWHEAFVQAPSNVADNGSSTVSEVGGKGT